MKSILVEYKDGSLQWIRASSEEEAKKNADVLRIKAECYGVIQMKSRRWKEGASEFCVEFLDDSLA